MFDVPMSVYPQSSVGNFEVLALTWCWHFTLTDSSSSDELPVSRISAILIASPLSDEDVELLMGKLLEKQESNVEWEAVSLSLCFVDVYCH